MVQLSTGICPTEFHAPQNYYFTFKIDRVILYTDYHNSCTHFSQKMKFQHFPAVQNQIIHFFDIP